MTSTTQAPMACDAYEDGSRSGNVRQDRSRDEGQSEVMPVCPGCSSETVARQVLRLVDP
jgi:hypothetical protein